MMLHKKKWLFQFTTPNTIQVLFLETAYSGVQQKCSMCTSYFITENIKKTCNQVLRFNTINIHYITR